jgi:hypothetical protein
MFVRWSGFADLVFAESASLAFARAAELADTDVHEQHQDAWVIDDRRLSFSLETSSSRAVIEGMKRFLGLLALQAQEGEAAVEIASLRERWVRRAASPSHREELGVDSESPPQSQTIRVAATSSDGAVAPSGRFAITMGGLESPPNPPGMLTGGVDHGGRCALEPPLGADRDLASKPRATG